MGKTRILIVDDEAVFTRMVKLNLEQTGNYEVRAENRAQHAPAAAREFKPDLILLDVIMPGLDGGELASLLRSDPALKHTPIVFLTATVSPHEAKGGGFTSGGFLFLAKPVALKDLVRCIESNVKKTENPAGQK